MQAHMAHLAFLENNIFSRSTNLWDFVEIHSGFGASFVDLEELEIKKIDLMEVMGECGRRLMGVSDEGLWMDNIVFCHFAD